jgi:hypothetical protein
MKETQLTGMAGEFLAAGKLFKKGLQVSITLGNAKGIDLFVHNQNNDKTYNVQVKTLRKSNCFPIHRESIKDKHIYIFIILNRFDDNEDYYVLRGDSILKDVDNFFGASYRNGKNSSMPAINRGPLKAYKDNWIVFDE